jgi:hypothetical protein
LSHTGDGKRGSTYFRRRNRERAGSEFMCSTRFRFDDV